MSNKLFKFTLPDTDLENIDSLYYHATEGVTKDIDGLILTNGAVVSLDTYYNCFSYSRYCKFTDLDMIKVVIEYKGSVRIAIKQATVDGNISIIAEDSVNSILPSKTGICIDITLLDGDGFIYPEITAESDGAEFFGGKYVTDDKPIENIKIGAIINTYKNEKRVLNNLALISKHLQVVPELKEAVELFVMDNGSTLNTDIENVGHIYPDANTGGSGGFINGIKEVLKREDFTHVLLIDDDIIFDDEIFDKLFGILRYAKSPDELCVSGSVLQVDNPCVLVESGAVLDGFSVRNNHSGINVSEAKNILKCEKYLPAEFASWRFMCMPTNLIEKCGLPLPMVLKKGTAIEYGLRCCTQLMVVNGLGVWHSAVEMEYTPQHIYYNTYNMIFINTVYRPELRLNFYLKTLKKMIKKQLFLQRYYAAKLMLEAYSDFLNGIDYFTSDTFQTKNNELLVYLPKFFTKAELENAGYTIGNSYYKSKLRLLLSFLSLNGYLIPNIFYNKEEMLHGRVINLTKATTADCFMSKTTIQYSFKTDKGFVTKLDRKAFFIALKGFNNIKVMYLTKYNSVKKEFIKNLNINS